MQLAMTNNCHKGCSYVQDTDENLAPSGMSSAKAPIQSYDNLPLIQIKKPPLNPNPKHKTHFEP